MSETPRTDARRDAIYQVPYVGAPDIIDADFARQLETELCEQTNIASVRTDEAEGLALQLTAEREHADRLAKALHAVRCWFDSGNDPLNAPYAFGEVTDKTDEALTEYEARRKGGTP